MIKNLVIIPTYNEKENVERIIRKVFSLETFFDILIVDDNSPDLTYNIVKELQEEYQNRLFLEVRNEKNGLGRAYIHGFRWALQKDYTYIYEMDADYSHNPDDLERLFKSLQSDDVDMVVGSRYSHGVNVVNWDMKRVLLSYFASKYVRLITGIPVYDTTAGFVGYSNYVLKKIDLDKIESHGYGFQVEMKYKVWCKGFNVNEIPIIFTDRELGESKMNGGIIKEAVFGVVKLRLYKLFNKL